MPTLRIVLGKKGTDDIAKVCARRKSPESASVCFFVSNIHLKTKSFTFFCLNLLESLGESLLEAC